jgi:hypothetical protein
MLKVTALSVTALSVAAALVVFAAQGRASADTVRGPWMLVSLASLGTVTWRCDPRRNPGLAPELPGLALGFNSARSGQTESISLRAAGRTIVARILPPGQTAQLPYLQTRIQRLDINASGEDGTLHGAITVDFAAHSVSGYCWSYMPPAVTVQLSPRR